MRSISFHIVGKTNVGKSTLINSILEKNILIESHKPHSTTNRVLGIYHKNDLEVIFLDTPGLSFGKKKAIQNLNNIVHKNIKNSSNIILVIDAKYPIIPDIENYENTILIINKIDLISEKKLLDLISIYTGKFKRIFSICAKKSFNIYNLINYIDSIATDKEWVYPKNYLTNLSYEEILKNKIQEVLFDHLSYEVPYNIDIEIEIENKVYTTILHINSKHQHIILGKIKKLSTGIREKLENFLNKKIFVNLIIK